MSPLEESRVSLLLPLPCSALEQMATLSHDFYNIHTGLARAIWTLVLMSDVVSITKKERRPSLRVTRRQAALERRLVSMCHSIPWLRSRASVNDIHFSGEIIIFRTVVYNSLWFSHRFLLFSSGLIN